MGENIGEDRKNLRRDGYSQNTFYDIFIKKNNKNIIK